MEKSKPSWNIYKDQNQQVPLLVAACLLCEIRPFITPPNSKNLRFDEWNFFVDEIAQSKKNLRKADCVHTEIKVKPNPYGNTPSNDSWVNAYIDSPRHQSKPTISQKIETVEIKKLIEYAKENGLEEAYIGLSGNTKEKPMQESERKALYKMILGMALSKYGLNPDKCVVGKDDTRGSIPFDLKELGLSVDRTTVVKHLKAALEEWGDTEDINRLNNFRKKLK